jgi:hypothetical protein
LERHECRPIRVVVVTFRVNLSRIVKADLGAAFRHYIDDINTHTITEDKVIVQHDSLHRLVINAVYDLVILDEAMSTFLHSSSPLMKNTQAVMSNFRDLLISSKRIVMLDACLDDTPGYAFVQWIERQRDKEATWVRNHAVVPPKKDATLFTCDSDDRSMWRAFKDTAIERIIEYMEQGHRVFVPCSSKTDAEDVFRVLTAEFCALPDDTPKRQIQGADGRRPVLMLITAATDEAERRNLANNFTSVLSAKDAFIISPSVTAGASFYKPGHFTRMVRRRAIRCSWKVG